MKNLLFAILPMLMINLAFSSTKTATITAHCYSFQLTPLDWKDGDVTYFTTYDGTSGYPYNTDGKVSGEVKPSSIGSTTYKVDYIGTDAYGVRAYGTLSMGMPSHDSNSNGVLDFLEKEKSVNANVTITEIVHWDKNGDYSAPILTARFSRNANSNFGTYLLTYSNGTDVTSYNFTGTWYISSWSGEVQYNDESNLSLSATSPTSEGVTVKVTGSGQYEFDSETLSLGGMTLTDGADTIYSKIADLSRNGNTYSGQLSLKDGEVDTSWVDFANWKVFITDTNDYDSDGIPDLTDPEPTSSGNNETKSSSYVPPGGWYWFGAYPWAYSYLENGWLYCRPASNGLYMYSVQNKSWSLYPHQN
jgi:hypothetical protein